MQSNTRKHVCHEVMSIDGVFFRMVKVGVGVGVAAKTLE